MCRWFVYLSPDEECLLEDVLITPAHGLAKQVNEHYLPGLVPHLPGSAPSDDEAQLRNGGSNHDGFGMAWYTAARSNFVSSTPCRRPCLIRYSEPPISNGNFQSLCANVATTCLFAHVRAGSEAPVTYINNHPFVFGRHTIMHNGTVMDFPAIRRAMLNLIEEKAYRMIKGTTDSEHIAALYMTYLTASEPGNWDKPYSLQQMNAALTRACATTIRLQQAMFGLDHCQANSLNIACSDGEQLVAFRYRNHAVQQPPSLYYSTTAGTTLNRKYPGHPNGAEVEFDQPCMGSDQHGRHIIVASEPTTYKEHEWTLMPKNHSILVGRSGDFKLTDIDLGEDYYAHGGC